MELTYFLTLLSYLSLAMALEISYGEYEPTAFYTTFVSLLALGGACFFSERTQGAKNFSSSKRLFSLLIGLLFCLALMQAGPPLLYFLTPSHQEQYLPFLATMAVTAILTALFKNKPAFLYGLMGLALLVWLFFSIKTVLWVTDPHIDVWHVHQLGAEALLNGKNPYSQIFPIPIRTHLFEITNRFVYPPLSLIWTSPFYDLWGDVRFGLIACQFVSALLLFFIARSCQREGAEGVLLTLLFLAHPRWFFILSQSWTEPLVITFCYASVLLLIKKKEKTGALILGLFLGAKQYLLPLIALFLRFLKGRKSSWILFFLAFLLIPLIFIVPNPRAYFENVIQFHLQSAFRERSLSLSSFLFENTGFILPAWPSFLLLLGSLMMGAFQKKLPKALLWATLGYFLFFWLNKQAFCNYYFFVEALLILALAMMGDKQEA